MRTPREDELIAVLSEDHRAVEQIFEVKVGNVNTLNRAGKRKRTRFGYGRRPGVKRAVVTVVEGNIDIFG